jgi:hypothetical protein
MHRKGPAPCAAAWVGWNARVTWFAERRNYTLILG